ncbi:hypothetical protein O181_007883 [Austropuccinia psidii MF-1]|uniref:DUF4219 domain-containing protein n=1 Tax=Austropuccinia psidii MF-1 TaxID=1389203 RepID=A0A9Q3BN37_9BASI|nr:hypothetical protein [Austropuccinia psidii MF-1]
MDKQDINQRISLKERNYLTWVTAIEAELRHIGCWKFVDGADGVITEEKKEKSYFFIMRYLDESIVAFVGNKISTEEKGDSRELLRMLNAKFVGSGVQAQGIALDRFLELNFQNLDKWIDDLQTTTRCMSLTGTDVNNALGTRLAIRKLPHKYEMLIRLLTYGNKYPTIKEITISVEKDQALFQAKKSNTHR